MRKKIATAALIGGIGLTGGLLIGPGLASAAGSGTTATGVSGRLTALKDALKGLVSDGTISQSQADKVATTLDENLPHRGLGGRHGGPGGPGHLAPAAVAKVLGITPEELRTQLQAGKTLAQIAAGKGMAKQTLIDDLVTAAKAELAARVKAGTLTQARADAISGDLTARITEHVDQIGGGHGDRPGPGADDGDSDDTAPSTSPGAESSSLTT